MQFEIKGVGHSLTKFQTGPEWAWEFSIFRLKPTFFAPDVSFFHLRLHGLAISDAISSLLLHINEPNKVDSERTQKDEEVGPITSVLAQFRNGDCFKMGVCIAVALVGARSY
jgi:hypothetical protein